MYLGNSPLDKTILRLMARKSFQLSLLLQDRNGRPLDITGATIRMVVRKSVPPDVSDDSGNLIMSSLADAPIPEAGLARFSLQASELDEPPGEYLFTIVLVTNGYSVAIVDGVLELLQNTEFDSMGEVYTPDVATVTHLEVKLRNQSVIVVRTGPALAPGQAFFSVEDEKRLDELFAGAVADGQTLNADLIPDGPTKVIMTRDERDQLAAGGSPDWDNITNKPAFGSAATHEHEDYYNKTDGVDGPSITSGEIDPDRIPWIVDLNGIVVTTSAPVGGNPGRITLKYTP